MSTDSFMAVLSNIMRQRAPNFDSSDAANYRSLKHLSNVSTVSRMQLTGFQIFKIKALTSALDLKRMSVARPHSLAWSNHTITLEMILHCFRPTPSRCGMTWVVAFSSDSLNVNQPVVLALLTGPVWSRCVDVLSSRWQVFYLTPDKQMLVSVLRKTWKESQAKD